MFCPKCGANLVDGARFCPKCGAQLINNEQPAVQQEPIYSQPTVASAVEVPTKSSKKPIIIISVIFAVIILVLLSVIIGLAVANNSSKKSNDGNLPPYEDAYREYMEDGEEMESDTEPREETKPTATEPEPEASAQDVILVDGIPADTVIGMTESEVQNIVGNSWERYGVGMLYEYSDDDWIIYFVEDGIVQAVNGTVNHYSLGGESLYLNESELPNILGSDYTDGTNMNGDDALTWTVGNNKIVFSFDYFSKIPYEVTIRQGDDYTHIIDGLSYYSYEDDGTYEDSSYYSSIDPELVGRWRSYDGGTLEINSSGYLTQLDFNFWNYGKDNPTYCQWTTDNGQISATLLFETVYEYTFTGPKQYVNRDTLTLYGNYGGSLDYWRESDGSADLVGHWKSEFGYGVGMDLYDDGTGKMNGIISSYDMTWSTYASDGKNYLDYTVYDYVNLDYKIYGDTLEIFTNSETRFYTKVGN